MCLTYDRVGHRSSTSYMKFTLSPRIKKHSLNSPPKNYHDSREPDIDDIPDGWHQRGQQDKHTLDFSDIRNAGSDRTTPSSRKIKPVWGEKKNVMSVLWRCWVLGFAIMWCCAVMFPEGGLDLLTAVLQTVGGRHLQQQFHHSPLNSFHPILLSISSYGETTLHLSIDSWFYQVETPIGGWVGWPFGCCFHPFCSFLEKSA